MVCQTRISLLQSCKQLFVLLSLLFLVACSSGSSSSGGGDGSVGNGPVDSGPVIPPYVEPPPVDPASLTPRTSMGTRMLTAEEINVDLSNRGREWFEYDRPAQYSDYETLPLDYITLPSGKRLAVRISLPVDGNGELIQTPMPVILSQTAYSTNLISFLKLPGGSFLSAPDPFFVTRGYAMVAVDVLGSGSSEGGWEMIGEAEQEAYTQVVDWVVEQPWSNGNIGVAGISYMGITAMLTAAQGHPAIKAAFCIVPLGDAMRGTVGTGGLINGVFMSYWLSLTHALSVQTGIPQLMFPEHKDILLGAREEHIAQIDNYYLPVIHSAIAGDEQLAYDGAFWETRSPLEQVPAINVPTFIIGGLHDLFQRDEPLLYEQIKLNTNSKLIIYDGDHATATAAAVQGNSTIPPAINLALQWFDQYVQGMDAKVDILPNVTQEVKNSSVKFSNSSDWPHPFVGTQRWYLQEDFGLSKTAPEQDHAGHEMYPPEPAIVVADKSENGKTLDFSVEPQDGTECSLSYAQWTLGAGGKLDFNSCFRNNRELEEDALNYETPAMSQDYYINGPIQADIWLESSVEDAVISVRIDEVSPSGRTVKPITNGLMLASMRAIDHARSRYIGDEMIQPWHPMTPESVMPLVPGEKVQVAVEVFPTSAVIRKGHKLRVSISASNQAQGILNDKQKAILAGGVTTIHSSADYPSSVLLPIVPLEHL